MNSNFGKKKYYFKMADLFNMAPLTNVIHTTIFQPILKFDTCFLTITFKVKWTQTVAKPCVDNLSNGVFSFSESLWEIFWFF
jgi:hypothetical protein